ncbi:MAG TPA: YggT family protein [Candidatus Omnitrophota bacterium]|nr:YggT family protein [Candidatus Omnitrophota bacterium]HPS20014.1 YggT family protein [Candidatus Omnitrophota bacterium]
MFIVVELLRSLALLVSLVVSVLSFLLVIRVILSWVNADPYNEIVSIIYKTTDPILRPLQALPLRFGGLDFSPILAFILLSFIKNVVLNLIFFIGSRIGA